MVRNKTKNSTKESTESEFAEITFTEEETMDNKTDSSSQRVGGRVKVFFCLKCIIFFAFTNNTLRFSES